MVASSSSRPCDRLEIDPGEAVEGVALCRLVQQGLVCVLAVEIDEVVSELGQQRRRRHPTVGVGARSPRDRDRPGEDDLAFADDEASFDHRLLGAGPHHGGVCAASEEELESLDDERLAGAGLAGEGGHARDRARDRGRR